MTHYLNNIGSIGSSLIWINYFAEPEWIFCGARAEGIFTAASAIRQRHR